MSDSPHDLLGLYFDDPAAMTEAQTAALAEALRADAAFRSEFTLHAALADRLSAALAPERSADAFTDALDERLAADRDADFADHVKAAVPTSAAGVPMYRKGYEPQPFKLRAHHVALAAAAVIAACGLAAYLLTASIDPESSPPEPSSPPPVATLIHNTGDLRTPHGYPAEGDDYGRGEYNLASGTAEFMLTNAVNVKLRGETRLVMRNDTNVTLSRGNAAFVVPHAARGFTVHLPGGARVVDLGTRFESDVVSDGLVVTRVLEGAVDVYSADGSRFTVDAGWGCTVVDGLLVSVDQSGLLVNGDFNTAAGDAWELSGQTAHDQRPQRAAEGAGFLNFNTGQSKPDGIAKQAFHTQPGRAYELSLLSATYGRGGPAQFRVRVLDADGNESLNETVQPREPASLAPARSYRPSTFRFTATGTHATLSIHDESPNNGLGFDLYIDNIRIVPVPGASAPPPVNP